jgi:tetratricopeptide (TPR) repeat protein
LTYSPLELAAAFIQTGELDDALAALNQHLEDHPEDDRVRRWRINVLRQLDHAPSALEDFPHLSEHTPDDMLNHSVLLEQAGEVEAAIEVMTAACAHWPENERLAERSVQLLMMAGRYDTALDVVRQQPRNWRWLGWEGDLLAQMGDDMTATARYGLALAQLGEQRDSWLGPIRARLLLARAHAYRRLEFYEQADEAYLEAKVIVPDDPMIPFLRGLLRFLQDDLETALILCRPAYAAASEVLRRQMQQELRSDSRYVELLAAVEGNRA